MYGKQYRTCTAYRSRSRCEPRPARAVRTENYSGPSIGFRYRLSLSLDRKARGGRCAAAGQFIHGLIWTCSKVEISRTGTVASAGMQKTACDEPSIPAHRLMNQRHAPSGHSSKLARPAATHTLLALSDCIIQRAVHGSSTVLHFPHATKSVYFCTAREGTGRPLCCDVNVDHTAWPRKKSHH